MDRRVAKWLLEERHRPTQHALSGAYFQEANKIFI